MNKSHGFTLIELMLTVTLIAVLSAIAYPNYRNFIKSTYKSTAENEMIDISYKLEKMKIKNFSYKAAVDGNGNIKSLIHVGYTPYKGEIRYTFSIKAEDSKYEIIAKPTERQGLDYGNLILSFDGKKYVRKWDIDNNNSYTEDW